MAVVRERDRMMKSAALIMVVLLLLAGCSAHTQQLKADCRAGDTYACREIEHKRVERSWVLWSISLIVVSAGLIAAAVAFDDDDCHHGHHCH